VKTELIDAAEKKSLKTETPQFAIGDTVDVHCKITEGDKTRVQVFSGTVIGRRGHGMSETFTVRRIVDDEGVERTFPLHSPNVVNVKTVRSGKTRRAKLYYLRQRSGKSVRLSEKRTEHTETES
jgi:large subunit ribosomal protein L19